MLATPAGRRQALDWCRSMHVDRVYVEVFRDGYHADPAVLRQSRDFAAQGLQVNGCVTTNGLGKPSSGWKECACYTNADNRRHLRQIFQDAARIFDRIIIDDFFFTDCTCSECSGARGDRDWQQYRHELMLRVAREDILGPVHAIHPHAHVIIKFPQWYDAWQQRGYLAGAESQAFDETWVGTETRDPRSAQWGRVPQYGAYFVARWLAGISGTKLGGGWFDDIDTPPPLYLDQAYVSLLTRLPEVLLFNYGSLQRPDNLDTAALRAEMPALQQFDVQLGDIAFTGIPVCKPVGSGNDQESYLLSELGMLGIPVAPVHRFPAAAELAFFSTHMLWDAAFVPQLAAFLNAGKTAIVTERLAHQLNGDPRLAGWKPFAADARPVRFGGGTVVVVPESAVNAAQLAPGSGPAEAVALPETTSRLRQLCLGSLGWKLDAPLRVLLFPAAGRAVLHNCNDVPVTVSLGSPGRAAQTVTIPAHRPRLLAG